MEVKGSVRMADGQKYLLVSQHEFEEFEAFRVIFDFAKEQDPEGFRQSLRELSKVLLEDFPKEYQHLIARNPFAAKYLEWFRGHRGRPEALTTPQRDFIAMNDKMSGKELYEALRASYGYTGALKTVQNELSKARKLNQEIDI